MIDSTGSIVTVLAIQAPSIIAFVKVVGVLQLRARRPGIRCQTVFVRDL